MQQFQLKNVKIAMKHRGEKRKFTVFYLVSLSSNTEVELLMKNGNQSTTTVSILIVQLRFLKKITTFRCISGPLGVVSSKDLQNSRGLLLLF